MVNVFVISGGNGIRIASNLCGAGAGGRMSRGADGPPQARATPTAN